MLFLLEVPFIGTFKSVMNIRTRKKAVKVVMLRLISLQQSSHIAALIMYIEFPYHTQLGGQKIADFRDLSGKLFYTTLSEKVF